MKRRTYLATAIAGAGMIAGCTGSGGSDDETPNDDDDNGTSDDDPSPEPPEPVDTGTFDDFEDLDPWAVLDGSLSADEDKSVVGSQSALLQAGFFEERVMIKREFDSLRDLSDKLPTIAAASDGVDAVVQLTDTDGDRMLMRTALEADGPLVARNVGIVDQVGTPDLSATKHVKISAWAGNRGSVDVWCDDLGFVSRPETGTVLLQFDDGFETAATEAAPILDEHGYSATAFVRTGSVGEEGKLDVDQLSELDEDGWAVGSQGAGATGLHHLDESEQEAQITDALDWFDENGFGDDVPFAYPNDNYDGTTLELVEEHHDLAFSGGYPVHGAVANPHLCPRVVSPSASDAEEILDRTAEYGGITTIAYRELDASSRDEFEQTVEYISDLESDGDLEVVLPGDLEDEHLA